MIHLLLPFKNLIFDLGGVILNLDEQKTKVGFKKMGIENLDEIYTYFKSYSFITKFETGKITADQFRFEMRHIIGKNVSDTSIDEAWNAMILDIPEEKINLLKKLKKKYNTYLLSNTNEIHLSCYNRNLEKTYGIGSLDEIMTGAYYSNKIGLRKPSPEAFEYVLKLNGLQPNETVFIDDLEPNIAAASKLGLKTLHLKDPGALIKVFEALPLE